MPAPRTKANDASESVAEVKVIWTLEMRDPSQFRPVERSGEELEFRKLEQPSPEFNWFLHQAVGVAHRWGGRDDWTETEWTEYVGRSGLETWVGYLSGAPAGYFELEMLEDGAVTIHRLGLLGRFIGKGFGGHLLTEAVMRAWKLEPSRVFLKTCSHDHPHARENYLARGFQLVDETTGPANRPHESVIFTCRTL